MGLAEIVFVIFLVLKLTGVIAWSWWWITAPLWISFIFWCGIFGSAVAVGERSKRPRR